MRSIKILLKRISRVRFSLVFCVLATLCFNQFTAAQSGRRPKPTPPPVLMEQPASEIKQEPIKIEILTIVGEILNNDSYSDAISFDSTLDYCLRELKNQSKSLVKAEVGGKLNYKEAQERAKKGKDVYVLWISFALENIGKGKTQVGYANFTILKPESGEKLFTGRIDSESLVKTGGALKRKNSISEAATMHNISEEIVYRLSRWGWLN